MGGGERKITRLRLRVAGERGGDLSLTTHRTQLADSATGGLQTHRLRHA